MKMAFLETADVFSKLLSEEESGQALVEYVLVLAFVALICIGGMHAIGKAAKKPLETIANRLGQPSHP